MSERADVDFFSVEQLGDLKISWHVDWCLVECLRGRSSSYVIQKHHVHMKLGNRE